MIAVALCPAQVKARETPIAAPVASVIAPLAVVAALAAWVALSSRLPTASSAPESRSAFVSMFETVIAIDGANAEPPWTPFAVWS